MLYGCRVSFICVEPNQTKATNVAIDSFTICLCFCYPFDFTIYSLGRRSFYYAVDSFICSLLEVYGWNPESQQRNLWLVPILSEMPHLSKQTHAYRG